MAVDILVVGAHPDDCEIFMGGTLIKLVSQGHRLAICDLTRGEAGTYGDATTRREEMARANLITGVHSRVTLDLGDGRLQDKEANRLPLIELIRELRPRLVFTFDERFTRHPDHRACAELVAKSVFLAGLEKLAAKGQAHRPKGLIRFPELLISQKPDFVIDISDCWEKRLEAVRCYDSQVSLPGQRTKTKTLLHSHHFWELLHSRSVQAGGWGGCDLAEPFYADMVPILGDPLAAFDRSFV